MRGLSREPAKLHYRLAGGYGGTPPHSCSYSSLFWRRYMLRRYLVVLDVTRDDVPEEEIKEATMGLGEVGTAYVYDGLTPMLEDYIEGHLDEEHLYPDWEEEPTEWDDIGFYVQMFGGGEKVWVLKNDKVTNGYAKGVHTAGPDDGKNVAIFDSFVEASQAALEHGRMFPSHCRYGLDIAPC